MSYPKIAAGKKSILVRASINDLKNVIKPWIKEQGMQVIGISKHKFDCDGIYWWNIKLVNEKDRMLLKLTWG